MDKNPYRHDGRADKDPYRHDRRADSHCQFIYSYSSLLLINYIIYKKNGMSECYRSLEIIYGPKWLWAEMVMGRFGYGPIWLWAEMTRNRSQLMLLVLHVSDMK